MYIIKKTRCPRRMERAEVAEISWPEVEREKNGTDELFHPAMNFRLGHDAKYLYFYSRCEEENPVITVTERNGAVWDDSCMELFFAPTEDCYFNFEMNAYPALLLYYGADRDNRTPVDETKWPTKKLKLRSKKSRGGWELRIRIPFALLEEYSGRKLGSGDIVRANVYQCGDNDQISHYTTWNRIDPEQILRPDFHQPLYFGEMKIE